MLFGLMKAIGVPPDELHDVPKKAHMCHVELTVELAEGSVFLLVTAPDDEDFIHTAWWDRVQKQLGAQYRAAFVFRWLSKRHRFYADGAGRERYALVLTPELQEAAQQGVIRRKKKQKRDRGFT